MLPWEREIYVKLLINKINDENEKEKRNDVPITKNIKEDYR